MPAGKALFPQNWFGRASEIGGLWLGAARPVELVIDADCQGVEVRADGDRRDPEIVVSAAEIVEVVLDLAGDVLNQPEFNAGAGALLQVAFCSFM